MHVRVADGPLDDGEHRVAILVDGKLIWAETMAPEQRVTFKNELEGYTIKEHL